MIASLFRKGNRQAVFCLLFLSCFLPGSALAAEPLQRLPGKFVWAELVTDDVAVSQRFYGGLFGWTFSTVNNYTAAFNDGEPVAGMVFHARPADPAARPRWICYVSSDDLVAATRTVQAAGGSVRVPPQAVPGQGERVVFADNEGALFGAMRSQHSDPEDYLADTGSWIWLQLMTGDVRRAADFYRAIGDYELFEDDDAAAGTRYVLARNGYARAAIAPLAPKRIQQGVKPLWLPFVRVDNVRATAARVAILGGKLVVPPHEALFDGRVALLEDPKGGLVGIMEWQAEADDEGDAP